MENKDTMKNRLMKAVFGCFLVFIGVFSALSNVFLNSNVAYAEPVDSGIEATGSEITDESEVDNGEEAGEQDDGATTVTAEQDTDSQRENEATEQESDARRSDVGSSSNSGSSCDNSLGSLGWLVCPATGKISEAVDWLYGKIEDVLVINPVKMEDGEPIYEIWKYFKGITNIVFIIFLLVVIYSQISGVGISNYGVKKALPKLIIAAILVNLSFVICSLAVDASNVIGNGLRQFMESIETSAIAGGSAGNAVSVAEAYSAMAGGTVLTAGGVALAFETGAIWMLIPTVLGAIVAVVVGLITIAMRQALVALLIMVAPLAVVAYVLPNTEQWFKKWKSYLMKMLVFYPMFSLLFGASSVAGWAIIASAKDGFWILLGIAVQIFPLFFAWSLMKLSGTILETINARMRMLSDKPMNGIRGWADSHRNLTRARSLAAENPYLPTTRVRQFLANRSVYRDEKTKNYMSRIQKRGAAYSAARNYRKDGTTLSREGERAYRDMTRDIEYDTAVLRHNNTFNSGVGGLGNTRIQTARLEKLDNDIIVASDKMKMEQARGELIEYRNAEGFHSRMEDAMNAHMDSEKAWILDANGNRVENPTYKKHFANANEASAAMARYEDALKTMDYNIQDVQYVSAVAAHGYDSQAKIYTTKMQKYFELLPPTKDVEYRLNELTQNMDAAKNIDAIVSGLRVLSMRGDTDMIKAQLDKILDVNVGGGVELGTHASQALAGFLMFDIKDSDPWLRRFGKYINLETARVYNQNDRQAMNFNYDEYLTGYHIEPDGHRMYAKKSAKELMEGTSLDGIERTAMASFDESLMAAYGYDKNDKSKPWRVEEYLKRREAIQTAFEPQFLSASLKYLSGSEQINSAVKFWTGYELKQKTITHEDGSQELELDENGDPVYALTPVWEKEEFKDNAGMVKDFFRRKTEDYFKDQTTGQILGMRTDYRAATMEHLVESYLNDYSDTESSEERRAKYNNMVSEIQSRYGDEDINKAKKKRDKDLNDYKMELAGRQVRKILGKSGKLKQIYRTRASGTAINAKDWLRRWVNLDNENELRKEMNYYEQEMKREFEKKKAEGDTAMPMPTAQYDPTYYDAEMSKLRDESRDLGPEEFYEVTHDKLAEWFPGEFMVWRYEQFHKDVAPTGGDVDDYYSFLKELLADLSNYPGQNK